MRTLGEVVNSNPLMVVEIGLVIGGGRLNRVTPVRAIIVGTRNCDLLATKLRIRICQAGVVESNAAGEIECTIGAESWTIVQARIASRGPPNSVEARQEATAPRLAIIGRTVVG